LTTRGLFGINMLVKHWIKLPIHMTVGGMIVLIWSISAFDAKEAVLPPSFPHDNSAWAGVATFGSMW
jgi:hypothetical protein